METELAVNGILCSLDFNPWHLKAVEILIFWYCLTKELMSHRGFVQLQWVCWKMCLFEL